VYAVQTSHITRHVKWVRPSVKNFAGIPFLGKNLFALEIIYEYTEEYGGE
tara:strand:+ start:900 stop:1049 length:150 start_codon:yes stop_codon:yes gene_type:complete